MSNKIILCFDGTSNEPADAVQERAFFGLGDLEDDSIANVLKLHLMLGGDLRGGNEFGEGQRSFYYPGVGTYGRKVKRAFNAALAPQNKDPDRIVAAAMEDLEDTWEKGDELFLFGFSRGAAIARQFASRLKRCFPANTPVVRFMGVFDTVASIGLPNLDSAEKPVSDVVFEDQTVADAVRETLHLVALDEKRKAFQPTLMNKDGRVMEVWFPGAHSDVGGGYRRDGLSDVALQFMLDELRLRKLGLQILHPANIRYEQLVPEDADFKIDYSDVMLGPNPLGTNHQQRRPAVTTLATLGDRLLRVNANDQPTGDMPLVHYSVGQRIYGDPGYKPQSLVHVKHRMLMQNGEEVVFDGLKEHRALGRAPLRELASGEKARVRVFSNLTYNSSGILLRSGEAYYFQCNMKQRWYDATIPATPKGWTAEEANLGFLSNLFVRFAEDNRRVPEANWFELCAAVRPSEEELFKVLDYTRRNESYRPQNTGEFCPFANDLDSRYGNNLGFIEVTVLRV